MRPVNTTLRELDESPLTGFHLRYFFTTMWAQFFVQGLRKADLREFCRAVNCFTGEAINACHG